MGTFLSSALVAAFVMQAPAADGDSMAARWARVQRDSTDGPAWLELGRAYVRLSDEYHAHRAPRTPRPPRPPPLPPADTMGPRAALDTAEQAFAQAARWAAGTRSGDSARVLRVFTWGERARLAWEVGGIQAAAAAWQGMPSELRLPPVLEELAENLLRACPAEGVLLTAGDADGYAAWYMRFARGLRPDLLVLPYAVWRADPEFRARVSRELKLPRPPPRRLSAGGDDPGLRALAQRRPVCASMGFERAPELRPRLRWGTRPLVWVAGPGGGHEPVSPQDFAFAALRLALDGHEVWAEPVVALYRRAVAATPALCRSMVTFGAAGEAGCR